MDRGEVVHYDESWVFHLIREAAERSGHEDSWFADDIAKGVILYLKEKFQRTSIGIEEFFTKIERTLRAVGFPDIAGNLEQSPPPARLCLSRLAEDAGAGFELMFFQLLGERVAAVRESGARTLHCSELRPAVQRINGTERWNEDCERLQTEILDFVANELLARERSAERLADGDVKIRWKSRTSKRPPRACSWARKVERLESVPPCPAPPRACSWEAKVSSYSTGGWFIWMKISFFIFRVGSAANGSAR